MTFSFCSWSEICCCHIGRNLFMHVRPPRQMFARFRDWLRCRPQSFAESTQFHPKVLKYSDLPPPGHIIYAIVSSFEVLTNRRNTLRSLHRNSQYERLCRGEEALSFTPSLSSPKYLCGGREEDRSTQCLLCFCASSSPRFLAGGG